MADKPVTREEKYLAYLTGDYIGEIPKPITRKEKYLHELCLKGIGGEISPEEIKAAVNEYLEKNPVKPGATTEQARQIEQNKTDVAALKEETGSLKEDIVEYPNTKKNAITTVEEGKWINNYGNVRNDFNFFLSEVVTVHNGETLNVMAQFSSRNRFGVVTEWQDGTWKRTLFETNNSTDVLTYSLSPTKDTCVKLMGQHGQIFNATIKKFNSGAYEILEPFIKKSAEELDSKFTTVVIGKNIFFSEWTETGYGIDNDTGVDKNGGNYQRTGYVEVETETTYTASTDFGKAPSVSIFYYDENKTFLSRYDTPYGFYPKTFTTPSNTKYLRIRQTYQAMPTNFQIEKGENATDYETSKREIMIPYSKITGIPSGTGGVSIANKKWLFLGDSITAMTGVNSWVDKFKELVSAHANSYNQAVGGSKWCDDEQGIIYDGKPYQGNKFIGNQVKWCENIGFSSDAFNCIIIAAGTNDTNLNFPNDDEIENAFYNGNSLKSLDGVDRSTWQGSVRYSVQRLKEMYPNAKIILVTPLQRKVDFDTSVTKDMYPIIRQKREIITKMARRMGVYIIDTCEANITDMSTDVHGDGLHLNQKGSTIMAEFMFRKIMPIMCDYN